MPGLTNNTNLLAAANQLIVAVNELSSRVSPDGSSIHGAITQVGSNLSTINGTLTDTNSIIEACCVGMQAKLEGVISSIRGIRLSGGGGGGLPTDGGGPFIDEPEIPIDRGFEFCGCGSLQTGELHVRIFVHRFARIIQV